MTEDKLQYMQNKQHHEPYLKFHSHSKLYWRYKTLRKQLMNLSNEIISKTDNDFKSNKELNETISNNNPTQESLKLDTSFMNNNEPT